MKLICKCGNIEDLKTLFTSFSKKEFKTLQLHIQFRFLHANATEQYLLAYLYIV